MSDTTPELIPQQFERFRRLIEARTGIYYTDSRRETLRRALAARLAACGAVDWEYYHRLLVSAAGAAEFRELMRFITVGETSFFRMPSHFDALQRVLIPALLHDGTPHTIHIWSAGCATGEEPYSIAMFLADMGHALRGAEVRILATDVCAEAVEQARSGRYVERALRGLPPGYVARHFRRGPDGYEVCSHLRQRVEFKEFNLAGPPYPRPACAGWDIIFCRNVTMYFRADTTRRVVAAFAEVLRPGGFLLLGPTESYRGICTGLETVEAAGAFVYAKRPLSAALTCGRAADGVAARGVHAVAPHPAPPPAPESLSEEEACARALAALASDNWDQAEQALGRFIGRSRGTRARVLLAWLWALRGEAHGATMICLSLLEREPLLGAAHYVLGLIARRAGDLDDSAEHLAKAIYSDSGLAPAYYHLGVVHSTRGDAAAARRAFRGALHVLATARDGWQDFAEGLTPEQWRRACEGRLRALAAGE